MRRSTLIPLNMECEASVNPISVAVLVSKRLVELKINYFVTGSVASSFMGEPRSTNDIDFVIDLPEFKIKSFVKTFETDFYINESSINEAVKFHRSFNLIHFDSVNKIDFFVPQVEGFVELQFRRKQKIIVSSETKETLDMVSLEDLILNKLLWYRKGGAVSELQLRDVHGIMKANKTKLDQAYLETWALKLGIKEELKKI